MRWLTLGLSALCLASPVRGQADVRYIDPDEKTRTSLAVVVGDTWLIHTSQVLPLDSKDRLVGKDRPAEQAAFALDQLLAVLSQTGTREPVKVNAYVARADVVDEVKKAFARRFRHPGPAVSFVVGRLPHPDALVALDAVAVANTEPAHRKVQYVRPFPNIHPRVTAAVLPPGPKVYVAGQAEKGDLATATRRTLESLRNTLQFLDLGDDRIVQLKAFLTPMADAAEVEKEMAEFFAGRPVPPLVFVAWKSSLPIEIELIAAAPRSKEKAAAPIDFLTPPGMTASPIYSRVTRINHGKTVYVSGLHGMNAKDAAGEVDEIFTTLGSVLKKAGSDFRHLAKATYYVSTDDASRKLNELRPRYYDPKRPPAASKAMVPGVGVSGRSVTLDMIAVVP